jgi:hypothetical protein
MVLLGVFGCGRGPATRVPKHVAVPDSVRGVYVNARATSTPASFSVFLDGIKGTTINSVVIDAKDDGGVLYRSGVHLARVVTRHKALSSLDTIISLAHRRDLHVIARIVTFKDPALSRLKPEWSLITHTGNAWKDRSGTTWLDPWNRDVWRYNIDLAVEVARAGADAIQFDYVRFPEPFLDLPQQVSRASRGSRAEAVPQFFEAAKERLDGLQVPVAADVFGYVMHAGDDLGIGQHWESMLAATDQVSPMIYPSHYSAAPNSPHPNACPYAATRWTIAHGIARAKRNASKSKPNGRIVPWLQAFQAPWIDRTYKYGPRAVRAQIQAVHDAGLRDWILWNASSKYEPFLPALRRGQEIPVDADVAGCSTAYRWDATPSPRTQAHTRKRSASPFDEPTG